MPALETHFDPAGICRQALEADLGIIVSTNNPAGFRRVMYKHMREVPAHKCSLRTDPESASRFFILRPTLESPDA